MRRAGGRGPGERGRSGNRPRRITHKRYNSCTSTHAHVKQAHAHTLKPQVTGDKFLQKTNTTRNLPAAHTQARTHR